ncbi:MAG: ATP-binding cassette domain-containing protein [candidate division Zixibacteria bacterium]|nr:ATP-binding cassette domain-containing protein [candidate division Zixibacteria bacterium]
MIVFDSVYKSFDGGENYAVKDVSFEVHEGETMVLLGSSGSGKTTVLKLANRLLELSSGSIEVDGEDVSTQDPISLRRKIGYVFQGIGLFPHVTIEENVAMVLRLLGWSKKERREKAHELLEIIGLDPSTYANRYPEALSGGQQQRVGVGRALAADPSYLLMDEPFGALDALTRDTLQQELLSLKEKLSKTIVFVTHDIFEALTLGDRIAVLHDGNLEQVGTAEEIVNTPGTDFVRELFEKPAKQLRLYGDIT